MRLARDKLQGLVARKFSYFREGDALPNMRLAGMVFGLEMIFNLGKTMCNSGGRGHRSALALPGFSAKATGLPGWLAGWLADARAVQFTRSKDGLGGVLRKVTGQQTAAAGGTPIRPSVQHVLLVNPLGNHRWFDSHPPLAERISRIYGRPMSALLPAPGQEPSGRRDAIF